MVYLTLFYKSLLRRLFLDYRSLGCSNSLFKRILLSLLVSTRNFVKPSSLEKFLHCFRMIYFLFSNGRRIGCTPIPSLVWNLWRSKWHSMFYPKRLFMNTYSIDFLLRNYFFWLWLSIVISCEGKRVSNCIVVVPYSYNCYLISIFWRSQSERNF